MIFIDLLVWGEMAWQHIGAICRIKMVQGYTLKEPKKTFFRPNRSYSVEIYGNASRLKKKQCRSPRSPLLHSQLCILLQHAEEVFKM
jgi:hypothetical protein